MRNAIIKLCMAHLSSNAAWSASVIATALRARERSAKRGRQRGIGALTTERHYLGEDDVSFARERAQLRSRDVKVARRRFVMVVFMRPNGEHVKTVVFLNNSFQGCFFQVPFSMRVFRSEAVFRL